MKRQAEIDTERIRRHLSLEKKDGCREEEEAQENSGQMGQKNTLDYFGYGEDVDKDAGTMIVSSVGEIVIILIPLFQLILHLMRNFLALIDYICGSTYTGHLA